MDKICAFSRDHTCIKWNDYMLTRHELEEADALCHENWLEIQKLQERIALLEAILAELGITIP